MKVMVDRRIEFQRPGTPLTFAVAPGPQVLPHDVRDYVIAAGAGRAIEHQPGDRSGGIAAAITRKQRRS